MIMVVGGALRLGLFAAFFAMDALASPRVPTYEEDVKPLLEGHCVECHHAGGARIDLTRFPFTMADGRVGDQEQIVRWILGKVDLNAPTMPPGVRTKLTVAEVRLIADWLEQGLNP
jgi:uncharacterized membrane protein